MTAAEWQGDALVLHKQAQGESFVRLVLFSPEAGRFYSMWRLPSARSRSKTVEPDLFDEIHGRFAPGRSPQMAFLQEWKLIQRMTELGRSYERLQWAVTLIQAFVPNLQHIENPAWTYNLLKKSLHAVAAKPGPDIAYCKALFLFAREEGYPVAEGWLHQMPAERKDTVVSLLQHPLDHIQADDEARKWMRQSLEAFLREHTDFDIPGSPA